MEQQRFHLFKVRHFTDAINDTLAFARDYFRQYGYVLLTLVAPIYLVGSLVYSSAMISFAMGTNFMRNLSRMGAMSGLGFAGIMIIALGTLVIHLLFISTFLAVEQSEDGRIDPTDIFRGMREHAGRMIVLYLQVMLIMLVVAGICGLFVFALISIHATALLFLGAVVLFAGAVYIAVPLSFLSIVYIREQLPLGPAMSRCFYLVRSNFWWTLLILFVAGLIGGFAGAVFQIPAMVLNFMKAFTSIRSGSLDFGMGTADRVAMGLSQFGSIVTTTVTAIATCIQYYSLVEKKDGTTLLQEIENIGTDKDSNDYYR